MRIVFLTTKLNFTTSGGSPVELDLKVRDMMANGHMVKVITLFSSFNDDKLSLSYPVIEEGNTATSVWGIQSAAFKALRKYESEADLFHVDGHFFLYGAGLYRRFGGKVPVAAFFNRELTAWSDNVSPFISSEHRSIWIFLNKKIRFYIEKYIGTWLANGMDRFAFTNPVLKKAYEDFGLRREDDALIMGDLIDVPNLMREHGITATSYRERNKTNEPLIIFYSARMVAGKGFDILLQAFSLVKNKEKYHLILGGIGPEKELLEDLVDKLKIRPYVTFPGWVSKTDVYTFFKKTDIFILSRWRTELIALVLAEALIFGLPVIVPAGGGLSWRAGDAALTFKDNDYEDLARKIEQLGDSRELRAELSRKCYEHITSDVFNHQKLATAFSQQVIALVQRLKRSNGRRLS